MMKTHLLYILLCLIVLPGCAQPETFDQMVDGLIDKSVPLIQPNEVTENMIILDAREKEEYEVSHIEGAIWVGYNNFKKSRISELAHDKEVVVYCSVGYRSEKIGEKIQKAGFKEVHNLYGGIFHWVNSGKEVVDSSGNKTIRVHAYNEDWGQWLTKGEKVY